ncbi:tRNA isopentenyl-2-thiomethyl-A-37 hydroxylase MiaE [Pseudoalteromonas sp. CO342X]|uniref:tRNA isopentenyl-2-thiomethyl-A-37 hydroxylase MiaE n=1 Tax=Pseudoalteromonas sp. CO342X TaxID=1777270 RepID=UPI001023CFD1|nr:tRNA isopentenyl-2-thiomethyl-A-37 hydroxylase MiaE [Pseudoalteromonas sp. CO342X]RZG16735.1 tRNA isopentenyl-2-thiomethyl-A-37 hydroxylase MiaE [Pseudoalteromonas sp. CO342X]
MPYSELLAPIKSFLQCDTPDEWITEAKKAENLPMLLLDHLICELKAGQTAMWLIRRYAVDKASGQELLDWFQPYENFVYKKEGTLESLSEHHKLTKSLTPKSGSDFEKDLINKMVLLIKEELHHFYQVLEIMVDRNIPYENITASRYAKGMMKHVRTHEPAILIDKLICGAYIEARSCERFAKLAPHLDDELNKFYVSLLRSEARHYQDYLTLAEQIAGEDISERIRHFGEVEAELISTSDADFKFHSGVPL